MYDQHHEAHQRLSPEHHFQRKCHTVKMAPTARLVLDYFVDELVAEFIIIISTAELAIKVGISKSSAARAVKSLCDLGLLVQQRRRQVVILKSGKRRNCSSASAFKLSYCTPDDRTAWLH